MFQKISQNYTIFSKYQTSTKNILQPITQTNDEHKPKISLKTIRK